MILPLALLFNPIGLGLSIFIFICFYARKSNQSIQKEISPECSLEGLMVKLRLQYFVHLMRIADSFKKPDAGKDWGQEERGMTEEEMVGWHHLLNGDEFE